MFILKTKTAPNREHCCKPIVVLNNKNSVVKKEKAEIRLDKNIPVPVESFIGRNQEVCLVLRKLKTMRLITLTGEPGIGKTSVAKFIANYIKSRKSKFMKNGVMFLNVINCSNIQMLKHKFVNVFKESAGMTITKRQDKKDTDFLFNEVLNAISNMEFLLIIDDAEDLLRTSKKMLKEFIEMLFDASSTIRLLLTSKIEMVSFLGGISGISGGSHKLKNLSLPASEKLLCEKAGKNMTREEKNKLLKMDPLRVHGGVKNAYQHLFDVILSGHPIAIGLAANIYSNSSIEFLYETLAKSSLLNTLSQGTIGKATINEKLRFSLNLTLRIIQDKNVLLFFNLMGYFPGGVERPTIEYLWPKVKRKDTSEKWEQYYHFLVKASFMTNKKIKVDKEWKEIYILVPMLKTLAEESRSLNERKKVHRCVTAHYVEILEELLNHNSSEKKINEKMMNALWYHEMNIWDCIYRALEIKRNLNSVKTGAYKLDYYESPIMGSSKVNDLDEEEKAKIEEESGPLDDADYDMILEQYKGAKDQKENDNEDKIIDGIIEEIKPNLVPKKKELKDNDLLKLFARGPNHNKQNILKAIPKKVNNSKSAKPKPAAGGIGAMLQKNIDKKLKKTVDNRILDLIKNNKELNTINKPKEEIYRKIQHKILEAQEEHLLYNGETTKVTTVNGKKVKQVGNDAKILILYISNLILFSKKTDAVKAIDEYGKYFYDKNLCEANLRKLKALALLDTRTDLNTNGEVVQELVKARLIFEQCESSHGQAICSAAIGYVIFEFDLRHPRKDNSLKDYCKKKFIEALTHYEKIEHKYGMSF